MSPSSIHSLSHWKVFRGGDMHGAVTSYDNTALRNLLKGLLEALLEEVSLFAEICLSTVVCCFVCLFVFSSQFACKQTMHHEHFSLLVKTLQCKTPCFQTF